MAVEGVFLIDRQRIQIGFDGKIFSLDFPETIIKDLEVIDKKLLISQIKDFVLKNKISLDGTFVMLTSDVCFLGDPNDKNYVSSLPFEDPVGIIIGNQYVATNRSFYGSFVDAVVACGGTVRVVAPIFAAKEMVGKDDLDVAIVKFVISNGAFYLKNSFTQTSMPQISNEVKEVPKTKTNRRQYILIGIFIVLLVILVIIIATGTRR